MSACTLRAASMPDHYGLGKPGSVAVRGKIGQRRGYFSAAAVYGVQVPLSGSGRGVAESLHQVLECRASGGGQGPPSVAQIMLMPTSA